MKLLRSIEFEPQPLRLVEQEEPMSCPNCRDVDIELDDELRGSLLWDFGSRGENHQRIEITVDGVSIWTTTVSMLVHGEHGWVLTYDPLSDEHPHRRKFCDCGAMSASTTLHRGYTVVTVDSAPWPWDDPTAQAALVIDSIKGARP